jgi:nitrile hydratase accessory protein
MTANMQGLREALPNLPFDEDGPVFQAPWQAQAFAMTLALYERGVFTWQEWASTLSDAIRDAQAAGDPDHGDTYYAHWLDALERICMKKGCTDGDTLAQRRTEWDEAARRTPHGHPIHLTPRRTLDAQTIKDYLAAVYRIFGSPDIDMRIGAHHAALTSLMKQHDATSAVFVTAFNPFGVKKAPAENDARNRALVERLGQWTLAALPGEGFDVERKWGIEASVFVPGATRDMADALLREFEQNAIVFIDERAVPELVLHPDFR